MQAGWIECFKPHNKTLYRTLLGMSLQTFQQLTGANYFFYYGASVFQSVGIQDSFVTQIILGAVNFGCTFLGMYVMERVSFSVTFVMANKLMYIMQFGRRIPLIVGGLWQSFWLFVFAAAGTAKDPTTDQGIGKRTCCLFQSSSRGLIMSFSHDCLCVFVHPWIC